MLEGVVNPYTIKTIEAIEGCVIEEFIKKISIALKLAPVEENRENTWLEHYPNVLEACDVQEILRVSEATAYEVLKHSECPTVRMGKRMVVPREAFWKFIQDHQGGRLW